MRTSFTLLPICLLLSIWAFAERVPTTQSYTFNPVTITAGGYVPGLIAHPKQPGLIYARTDIGSVYRWDLASSRWIPLTDFNSPGNYNLNGPESVALDPTDPNRLYIAAGMYTYAGAPYAVLVSTNRGASFQVYPVPFSMGANNNGRSAGERLAVNPFKPAELMMGTRANGLWVSEDNAQNWSHMGSFPVQSSTDGYGVQWVLFDPHRSGVVYAGAYTTATIYRSTDGGATWASLPGQPTAWPFSVAAGTAPPAPERAVIGSDGLLYAILTDLPGPNAMNFGLLEKFDPASNTWTNVTPPFDTANGQSASRGGFGGLSQDPAHPNTIAVSTFDRWYPVDTVYLTRDGGSTWADLGKITSNGGSKGPQAGNFYFDPTVFSSTSPWLTFGNTAPDATAKFGWWISALLIDPANPDHLMFATGATVYATNNLSAAFSGTAPTWFVQARGIEETAVTALISPREGAHLVSGMGDIGGFRHDDFAVSPVSGMFSNPTATTLGSLDWAGQNPSTIVRTQSPGNATTSPCSDGALSTDGGTTWAPMPTCATGANSGSGGVLTTDASGVLLMWTPPTGAANRPQYSTDMGHTWIPTAGLPALTVAVADKITPGVFYAFHSSSGSSAFYSTTNTNGQTFTSVSLTSLPTTSGCNTSYCGIPVPNWSSAGDLWLPLGNNGLFHSLDGGVHWTKLANVSAALSVAVGAAAPRGATQSVFLYGNASPTGISAIYRSDNNGASWLRINDERHQYGGPTLIQADPRVFGRVYLGMNGRGIVYGDISTARTMARAGN